MTPFLYRVAKRFYTLYGDSLHKHTFVFPNRRAGLFFQKYLAEIADKPLFSPQVITINEFIEQLSDYQLADKIELLVMLYDHFIALSKSEESFDDFVYWGEMLLSDFDDVDKYMVDAKQLFTNVTDLKSIDDHATYLTATQIAAIRQFWTNFMPYDSSDSKKKFMETWQVLFPLYTQFREELQNKDLAYQGMIYRDVAERAKNKETLNLPDGEIVFVGLHALSTSEIKLLQYLKTNGNADFYWDYESPFVDDPSNKASVWVERNRTLFPSKQRIESPNFDHKINLEIMGIPSGVGQAKHATSILNRLIDDKKIPNPSQAINTAVILPDEGLLLPVLYSVPESIGKINVTMGYSLTHSAISGLIKQLSDAQRKVRMSDDKRHYYFRYVISILNNSLVKIAAKEEGEKLKANILANNQVMVPEDELQAHPLLQFIFRPIDSWQDISEYLKLILTSLYGYLTKEKQEEEETEAEEQTYDVEPMDLEREFVVQYFKTITRLEETLKDATVTMSFDTYFKLLDRLAQSLSVSFSGEPLAGLQIMGVLETRVLDFENIIILSMNEGVFPLKKPTNSFIPYTLRKGFDMPTFEYQDSIFAYHFYRMISRAKNVYLLYDTRSEGSQSGEVSRYFYQIKYLYPDQFNLNERLFTSQVKAPQTEAIVVEKTDAVWKKLSDFLEGGERALSASAFNNYIDCPLRFYLMHVEELSEEEEVEESVEYAIFGSILHEIMQIIYDRYKGSTVTASTLNEIRKNDAFLTEKLEQAFAKLYTKQPDKPKPLKGNNYLVGETLRNYIKQVLAIDARLAPFNYIDSEFRFKKPHKVNEGLAVNFKGSIDRIDAINGTTRIIDYKSGTGDLNFNQLEDLFDSSKDKRPKPILQVFIYAFFYHMMQPDKVLSPGIYFMRKSFQDFSSTVTCNKQEITDISVYFEEFESLFNEKITELFNKEIPFMQTENVKNCQYCPFREMCGR
ncbi:MAG: PD-(D/E)XK nuclease family protein [Dysgonamonadaceae bacterium]|nr:PD-(D/E)XK nuclease family protein [Dysgonamonadaceae bacterium]